MKKNGFTLVEVVITAVIFSIISVGLAGSFFSGMKLWGRAESASSFYNNIIINTEKISRELRQAQYIMQIGFKGGLQQLAFLTLKENIIYKVTYRFDPEQKALLVSYISLKDILAGKEKDKVTEVKFMGLDDFSIEFLTSQDNKYIWKDKWEMPALCPAVKMKFKLNDEELTRTVFIPAA